MHRRDQAIRQAATEVAQCPCEFFTGEHMRALPSNVFGARIALAAVAFVALASGAPAAVTISTDPTQNMSCSGGTCALANTSGPLAINGKGYALANSIATLASAIASNPKGKYALANTYDASVDGTYAHPPIPQIFYGSFEGLGNHLEYEHQRFDG